MLRRRALPICCALVLGVLASSCISSRRAEKGRKGFEETGIASWYGPGFHGRTTANGESYDMEAMTAAHKRLPFGSIVEVKNRDNGRTTRVRINDRGPFVRGRIIDLSKAAAREIGMLGPGTARVRIRVVGRSERVAVPSSRGRTRSRSATVTLQAGAFRDLERAETRLAAVRVHYRGAHVDSAKGLHRVLIGGLSEAAAHEAARTLERYGIETVIVR